MEFFKPGSLNIDFVGKRKGFIALSIILVLGSIAVFTWKQLADSINWGIDFAGGTVIDMEFAKEVDIGEVRKAVTDLGYDKNVIQRAAFVGKEGQVEYIIRVERIAILSEKDAGKLREGLGGIFGDKMERLIFDADSGDQFELRFSETVTESEIRAALKKLSESTGRTELASVVLRKQGKEDQHRYMVLMTGVAAQIEKAMKKAFPKESPSVRKVEFVGPQVGSKLRTDGILAMIYAIAGILIYVAFRFNLQFAPGAVLALAHDAVIVIGLFALLGLEFNLTFVAAILTVIGYSVNDTIVVYDRIRENLARFRSQSLDVVINTSLNEVLNRTVLTSLTTVFALLGLLVIGFGEIQDFAIAMTFGVVVGTYSSIYVAGSTTIWLEALAKKMRRA
ncbi:MAG: protein translocase subunit SecF [Deltaproteobacteria bacterium]|nr:protein translocase subunit SecF [Deltaproteobacteria bacterium]